ncbi:MAG: type II secretion system GspH family protein [Candidatus Gastranaerophilales bacterium]|nr:type II secretion system GspH family protein [Candidatus Gastranaerophilales bacterium]
MHKKGFTLAEVLIALVVVGVLSAILIPTLITAAPDEELLRAKKAYNTLVRALEYLTNSGPYDVTNGNLDATAYIRGTTSTNKTQRKRFLCNNLAEVLNTKSADCTKTNNIHNKITNSCTSSYTTDDTNGNPLCIKTTTGSSGTALDYDTLRDTLDSVCENTYSGYSTGLNAQIETTDNILWSVQNTNFSNYSTVTIDGISVPSFYGVICIDTGKSTSSDYVFGMGVRRDGRVITGTKLQELLEEDDEDTD